MIAVYAGSFDPITNGHLDLIERGARLFDCLIVSILRNESKQPLFSVEERMEMLREVVDGVLRTCEVDCFDGLLVDHAAAHSRHRAAARHPGHLGLRVRVADGLMNRRLRPDIETVFLMANEAYSFISSRLVKEVFSLGGNISGLVPPCVEARLKRRLSGTAIKGF